MVISEPTLLKKVFRLKSRIGGSSTFGGSQGFNWWLVEKKYYFFLSGILWVRINVSHFVSPFFLREDRVWLLAKIN